MDLSINAIIFLNDARRSYFLAHDKKRFENMILPGMIFKYAVQFGICFHKDDVLKAIERSFRK